MFAAEILNDSPSRATLHVDRERRGHHRTAAAARVYQSRKGAGQSGWFLSVIFPHDQVQILPYHRLLKDLNGHSPNELLKKLETIFVIKEEGVPQPKTKHQLGLYLEGKWRSLIFHPDLTAALNPSDQLDAALLQKAVLAPLFGIDDPRISKRISFVGGIIVGWLTAPRKKIPKSPRGENRR